jgi:chorismate mutase
MSDASDRLEEFRKEIDTLDEELLRVLAERMDIARQIGSYKKANGLELTDPKRMETVLAAQMERAKSADLPEEFVKQLYEIIYKHTIAVEAETP